mmetsp:Transcript_29262/g.78558  ORF Transcript_29262/g.78558 Transcript_29262/m.78558 type:complete len:205 (-) Transcript_29262:23-637(-)
MPQREHVSSYLVLASTVPETSIANELTLVIVDWGGRNNELTLVSARGIDTASYVLKLGKNSVTNKTSIPLQEYKFQGRVSNNLICALAKDGARRSFILQTRGASEYEELMSCIRLALHNSHAMIPRPLAAVHNRMLVHGFLRLKDGFDGRLKFLLTIAPEWVAVEQQEELAPTAHDFASGADTTVKKQASKTLAKGKKVSVAIR